MKKILLVALALLVIAVIGNHVFGPMARASYGEKPLIGFSGATSSLLERRLRPEVSIQMTQLGAQIEHQYGSWAEIEPRAKDFKWDQIDAWYQNTIRYGFKRSIYIGPVDMNPPASMPADLVKQQFDDPQVIKRFKSFVTKFMARYPKVEYLGLGNEVNTYFKADPESSDAYLRFAKEMTRFINTRYPKVKVYVIVMASDLTKADIKLARKLQEATNLLAFTYYKPVYYSIDKGEKLPFGTLAADFKTFDKITGGRKFIISETAAVSSEVAGGSPDYQVLYIKQLFRLLQKYRDKIEFVCWFMVYDWPPGGVSQMHPNWEILASLGIFNSDGSRKASYYTWKEETTRFLGRK